MRYQKIQSAVNAALGAKPVKKISVQDIDRLNSAADIVLATLAVAGIATITLLAPNALQVLKPFLKKKYRRSFTKDEQAAKLGRACYYLKNHGYVKFQTTTAGKIKLCLTRLGRTKAESFSWDTLNVPAEKVWKKSWWQIAADIPTKRYRKGADMLRNKLKSMGFYSLQRTLWYYPFDPRREIEFIIRVFGIERFVTVMEVKSMDISDQKKLLHHFKTIGVL